MGLPLKGCRGRPTSELTLLPITGMCRGIVGLNQTSFKKGQSGNPKGKPKSIGLVTELARKRTAQTINRLVYWSEQDLDPQVSLRATIALHEIAWGKPGQAVQITGDMTHKVDDSVTALLAQIRNVRRTA